MLLRVLPGLLLLASLAVGQPAEQVVTNGDVSAMLGAGLAESTIVRAINLAAARGTTRFDTSPAALIRLKNEGASTAVLDAIVAAAYQPEREPAQEIPGLPLKRGVYYAGARMVPIPAVVLWPEAQLDWIGDTPVEKRRYVLAGEHAEIGIASPQPVFYVRRGKPDSYWQLVKLEVKRHSRVWKTGPSQMPLLSEPLRIAAGQAVPLDVTRISGDVLELSPAVPLSPGEYAIVTTKASQRWLSTVYAFAVTGAQPR
ncbi:MAG: hypothetical protein ACM3ZB_05120 [bacterium]|jgi:hypothetical protein